MTKIPKKEFWGGVANEEWHLFISNKHSDKPFVFENIGITHPHPNYCVKREQNNMFIIEYIAKGKGYVIYGDKYYEVCAGDTMVIEPGYKHCYWSDSKDPMEAHWINFSSATFHDTFRSLNLGDPFIFKGVNSLPYFNELYEIAKTSNSSDDVCLSLAPVLYDLIFFLAKSREKENNAVSPLALEIKQMLDDSMFANLSVNDIAKKVNFSNKQITREFKKYYNDTPHNYLLHIKVKMAKRYLKTSNMTINEIADTLAFDNQHYFSAIFKKKVGMSPNAYRLNK